MNIVMQLVELFFSGNEPVYYELALKGTENLTDLDDGDTYIGFPVDSGLATIVDAQTIETYNKIFMNNGIIKLS